MMLDQGHLSTKLFILTFWYVALITSYLASTFKRS